MRSTSCSGTGSITSISPDSSAATRVASLPIGVKIDLVDVALDLVPVVEVAHEHRAHRRLALAQAERAGAVGLEATRCSRCPCAGRPAARPCSSSHHFLLMMYRAREHVGQDRERRGGLDLDRVVVDLAHLLDRARCSPSCRSRRRRRARSEKTTSSAVNGVPSWNLTPLRRSKRHTVGAVCFHSVASAGTSSSFLSRPTSGS